MTLTCTKGYARILLCLLSMPDVETLKGLRDRAIVAVRLGCGLRRSEVIALRMEHVQQREGRWVIVDLVGKGNRVRTVPMPAWAKAAPDAWTDAAPSLSRARSAACARATTWAGKA